MSTSTRSRHMRRKVIPIVALAAAGAAAGGIAVLSGCGSTASAGSAPASIAGYVPASSPLYVQVSTDTAGTQWTNLTRLGKLFPGFGEMRAELDKALAREGSPQALRTLVAELLTQHYDPHYARSQRSHLRQWEGRQTLTLPALNEHVLDACSRSLTSA